MFSTFGVIPSEQHPYLVRDIHQLMDVYVDGLDDMVEYYFF